MDLSTRSTSLEIMDDLNISGEVVPQTLRELDTINHYLGGNQISLSAYDKILKSNRVNSLVDLGCGSADILKRMARKHGHATIDFTGIDANPHIVKYAQENTSDYPNIQISCQNILSDEFRAKQYDVIHCCLFLHHFTHTELVSLFGSFKYQARVAIIVNDLHRHYLAFHSIKFITRVLSKSFMVRNDAAISVARGFLRSEIKEILRAAGLTNYSLQWKWAFRWQLIIYL